ncbi:lantibiotic dehydratase [Streptomyces sp. NPDC059679]|uniref:lantibiotic dehydratase n=1 Tax=Streptomyces sp. NPDC059679 TaxID=3346903 RepID=UPI0036AFA5A6
MSLSTGRLIEPSVMNAVELSSATHPLARFVSELHRSHTAILTLFAWGAAARLPFLPEIRVGRTILSAACWRLSAHDLSDEERNWIFHFTDWRIRYGVPRTVYVGSSDQRLRLDLDIPTHQQLLRAELDRHETVVLHEAPGYRRARANRAPKRHVQSSWSRCRRHSGTVHSRTLIRGVEPVPYRASADGGCAAYGCGR